MKFQRAIFFTLFFLCSSLLIAQLPTPPDSLEGESLRIWLKENYYDDLHQQLNYTPARRLIYNYIDNHNNEIECVYGGYIIFWPYGGTGTNPQPINCEHTVPQSFFAYLEPMKSDLHHLFPVHGSINSSRSNNPYAEIDDFLTAKWWANGTSQTTIPSSGIDGYSEYYAGTFEPREAHKGNVARAIFYFYTMYPAEGGNISQVADINTLYQWHLDDPVDANEIMRNDLIESYQGDRNPYIDFSDLVAAAWGFTPTSTLPFFSEYVEGSSYNKALEIVNLTGSPVDLSAYSVKKQTNGAGSWTSGLNLSGTLNDGDVYVIAHPSASSTVLAQSDLASSNSTMSFNGNDPVGLFLNDSLIDIVGDFNGGSPNFAANTTLRRNTSVTDPSSTYAPSEWDSYASNTFDNLGVYGTAKASSVVALNAIDEARVYPNPFQDQTHVGLSKSAQMSLEVELVDMTGRVLHQQSLNPGETLDIEAANLSTGMYLLRVNDGEESQSHRLIKQ